MGISNLLILSSERPLEEEYEPSLIQAEDTPSPVESEGEPPRPAELASNSTYYIEEDNESPARERYVCQYCGRAVKSRRQRYCSSACKQAAYRGRNRKAPELRECLDCQKTFVPRRESQKHCSHKCRKASAAYWDWAVRYVRRDRRNRRRFRDVHFGWDSCLDGRMSRGVPPLCLCNMPSREEAEKYLKEYPVGVMGYEPKRSTAAPKPVPPPGPEPPGEAVPLESVMPTTNLAEEEVDGSEEEAGDSIDIE